MHCQVLQAISGPKRDSASFAISADFLFIGFIFSKKIYKKIIRKKYDKVL